MSGQDGPVRRGLRSGTPPMDLDRAVNVVEHLGDPHTQVQADELADSVAALRTLVNTARAYVHGQSPGRLEALAAALQEPVGPAVVVDVETVVQSYLTERDLVTMPRAAARAAGFTV